MKPRPESDNQDPKSKLACELAGPSGGCHSSSRRRRQPLTVALMFFAILVGSPPRLSSQCLPAPDGLMWLLGGVRLGLAQTVPMPAWLSSGLSNRPPMVASTNVAVPKPATTQVPATFPNATSPHVGGLSEQDLAMADTVIAESTLTLRLPGLGTSKDGPGPVTEADRLVLLALKVYHQRKAVVPFGEFRQRLESVETRERYRQAAEEFWAWYREAAVKCQADQLGGFKSEFSTYIDMKNTARRKAANRVLAGQVESEAAWRRAVESDRKFREKVASRRDSAVTSRDTYLEEWHAEAAKDAEMADTEWKAAMEAMAGHMDGGYDPGPHMRGR